MKVSHRAETGSATSRLPNDGRVSMTTSIRIQRPSSQHVQTGLKAGINYVLCWTEYTFHRKGECSFIEDSTEAVDQ